MNAQINTYSPYSYYGLGDLQVSANTYNMSLGGLGVGLFSKNILNYRNTYVQIKNINRQHSYVV